MADREIIMKDGRSNITRYSWEINDTHSRLALSEM